MKRFLAAALVMMIGVIALTSCAAKDEKIDKAITALKDYWTGYYSQISEADDDRTNGDWYLEIKNTRLVELGEDENDFFKDVEYIIEFITYSNFYGAAPYYASIDARGNNVIVYKDGRMEVGANELQKYIARYYEAPPVLAVHDYGSQYNAVYHLEEQ